MASQTIQMSPSVNDVSHLNALTNSLDIKQSGMETTLVTVVQKM